MNTLKTYLVAILIITSISCTHKKTKSYKNEWRSLFNGKDLNGWVAKFHHHKLGDNYANTFRVHNGTIQVNYDDYTAFDERYGHLFYDEPFSSYHLKFEYKFTDQWLTDAESFTYRNSGIMFHSQDPKTILKEQDWPISVEYQILADEGEGEPRPTGNMCSPGTDVVFNNEIDRRHCIRSSSKTYQWHEWVQGELIVYRDSLIIHKVNGKKVLEYTKPQIGGGVANGYDPVLKIDGTPLTNGYIGLQAEGQGIEFKNIMIKELD
jgi:3-keto-disaccharide hydrolase